MLIIFLVISKSDFIILPSTNVFSATLLFKVLNGMLDSWLGQLADIAVPPISWVQWALLNPSRAVGCFLKLIGKARKNNNLTLLIMTLSFTFLPQGGV